METLSRSTPATKISAATTRLLPQATVTAAPMNQRHGTRRFKFAEENVTYMLASSAEQNAARFIWEACVIVAPVTEERAV